MSDVLDADDADKLRDFADRSERAAKTARRIAPANPRAAALLENLAVHAGQAIRPWRGKGSAGGQGN